MAFYRCNSGGIKTETITIETILIKGPNSSSYAQARIILDNRNLKYKSYKFTNPYLNATTNPSYLYKSSDNKTSLVTTDDSSLVTNTLNLKYDISSVGKYILLVMKISTSGANSIRGAVDIELEYMD